MPAGVFAVLSARRRPRSSNIASAYRDLELSMGPLALWGLGDPPGLLLEDVVGSLDGSYSGTVQHQQPALPQNDVDQAVNFAGTGSGLVLHTSALALPALSLSFWFTVHAVPGEGGAALPLVTKTIGSGEHNFVVYISSGSNGLLRTRFVAAAGAVDIDTEDEAIAVGVPWHLCVRAGGTGFDAVLNGRRVGRRTAYTSAWSLNTNPLKFASGDTFSGGAPGNCTLDEVALYPRVLSDAEVVQLAQREGILPIARADVVVVPENATTAINVLDNDDYHMVPTIIPVPGSGPAVLMHRRGSRHGLDVAVHQLHRRQCRG